MPRSRTLFYCSARFWSRVVLSCRLTRLDLHSVQSSNSFKDGVLRRLHCRISSFWTCPGRFRRIVSMCWSGVGDVSMTTMPGVSLWGGKPRRKYFSSLYLTRWTDHLEPKTFFYPGSLLIYHVVSCVTQVAASTRDLFGWIRVPLVTSSNCVAAWPILDVVTYPRHIAFLASFRNLEMSKEPALDAFCQLHDRTFLGSQRQSREVGESEQREVPQDVIRGPATTCVLFRASEGQFKVRRLFAITVVDSCSNNIVEYCILRALYMSSNSLSCDIFATLTQEIVTCPSCGLERLLFVCNLGFSEGQSFWKDLYYVRLLIKCWKKFLPRNNRYPYANIIHVMHETSRPIRTQDLIGCHDNKAEIGSLGAIALNQLVVMATAWIN